MKQWAVCLILAVLLSACSRPAPVEGPSPESKVEPAPQLKVEPAPQLKVEPAPQLKVEPAPQHKVEPAPQLKVEPAPQLKVEPAPQFKIDSAAFATLETPTQIKDLMGRFATLAYEWTVAGETQRFSYTYVGPESVGGVRAEKVQLQFAAPDGDPEMMELWLTPDGKTVRWVQGGEELPAEMTAMGTVLLQSMLWPLMVAQEQGWREALTGATSGYQATAMPVTTRSIGTLSPQVHSLEVKSTVAGQLSAATWEIADFGSFQMFVGWQTQTSYMGKTESVTFKVTDVKLR